jgi:hypothetical protein
VHGTSVLQVGVPLGVGRQATKSYKKAPANKL